MRRTTRWSGLLLVLLALARPAGAVTLAESISVAGDSISRGFDANTGFCNYGDNVGRSWATGDDHGSSFCAAGSTATLSHAERLECAKGANVTNFNDAASGAKMLSDFANQATNIKLHLVASVGPRYVPVFMGHNDACTSVTSKTGNSCSGDQDPNNYCRTTNAAFEREFRRGMDQLIQIPNARVGVLATVRASELCNFTSKSACGALGIGGDCTNVWRLVDVVSGSGGICASLTTDCSNQRRIDMYQTLVGYNDILEGVTAEYAAIPTGGASATGAVKAPDVQIRFGRGTFNYRFSSGDISCCDCFHPSDSGQAKLATFTFDGLQCSAAEPCCATSGNALTDAKCDALDTTSFYPGGFWPNGVACGNGILDPDEQCDDGNQANGDCCSSTCQLQASGSTCTSDGNVCTNDVCNASGVCTHPANSATCDDGNACTQVDVCSAGTCTGTTPTVCSPGDQCHDAGVCNPSTGECSNAVKPDDTACNDGNGCTVSDTCQAGICTGGAPIVCAALDQCHVAGTCSPATGVCTNPAKPNGTGCNDGSACTQTDTCQAGTCTGASPIVCSALDQCHQAGTCDPSSGVCSNPAKPNGATCSDGDACTQSDTCQAGACTGASPVVCTALDQCHQAGTCDPSSGVCSNPAKPNGATCSDGNACTQTDTCQAGACAGASPVVCTALDQCHQAGTCDPSSGLCSSPAKPNGATCSDGNACTQTDTCQAGACAGASPVVCTAPDSCHDAGTCDPSTGVCPHPAKPDGAACSDGDACTQSDTCAAGACVGADAVVCAPPDQCHAAGVCDPSSGACSTPALGDGTTCDDGDACTSADACLGGVCQGTRACGDGVVDPACGEQCDAGTANGSGRCCSATCELVDGDGDGICDADDPCTGSSPVVAGKLTLTKVDAPAGDDKLVLSGTVTLPYPYAPALAPHTNGVRLLLTGAQGTVVDVTVPPGPYGGSPAAGWRVAGGRVIYVDKTTSPPGGIVKVLVRDLSPRKPGTLKFKVIGKHGAYPIAPADLPIVATLVLDPPSAETGQCAAATFPSCTLAAGRLRCR